MLMKRFASLLAATALALLIAGTPAHAADGQKKKKAAPAPSAADPMARFDVNANGVLETKERDALRAAFAKEAALKPLDLNADGKLDESEINAVEVPPKAKGGGKKKKSE
jgi:hypothetical protein